MLLCSVAGTGFVPGRRPAQDGCACLPASCAQAEPPRCADPSPGTDSTTLGTARCGHGVNPSRRGLYKDGCQVTAAGGYQAHRALGRFYRAGGSVSCFQRTLWDTKRRQRRHARARGREARGLAQDAVPWPFVPIPALAFPWHRAALNADAGEWIPRPRRVESPG